MTQTQVDLIVGAVWLVCVIVCILKWKIWTAILAIGAGIAIAIGPLITGNYLFNLLSPVAELRLNRADQAASELNSAVNMRPHYLALAESIMR